MYYDKKLWDKSPLPVMNIKKIDKEYAETKEQWKQIVIDNKYKTCYFVSTHGRIWNSNKKVFSKQDSNRGNYPSVAIKVNNVYRNFSVHRLVAIAFIEIPKKYIKKGMTLDDLVVNHKDGYKWHNMFTNLEWVTNKENIEHARRTGLNSGIIGENSHLAKMTNEMAKMCCELISKGYNNEYINKKLGISKKIIQHIRMRETWKEISKDYDFPRLGKQKPNSIPTETIHKICKLLESKRYNDYEIAKKFNISREHVRDIRLRKTQKSLSAQYDF